MSFQGIREYTGSEHDQTWSTSDRILIMLIERELLASCKEMEYPERYELVSYDGSLETEVAMGESCPIQ